MTCRHKAGDPDCSSSPEGARREAARQKAYSEQQARRQIAELRAQIASTSPDNTKFDIDEVVAVGPHLVLRVIYPNCVKCAYEGKKVLVYLNVAVVTAMKWRSIDPHFRAMDTKPSAKEAPPPAARFPASDEGWRDAIAWAQWKSDNAYTGVRNFGGADIHEGGTR